jgi:hypothetical protein
MKKYTMPGDGRGYYRTPSLVSLWSTAPFFHNNGLGRFTSDPSVEGRMEAFSDAVEKLLWPEKRPGTRIMMGEDEEAEDQEYAEPFTPPIYRTIKESYIVIHKSFLPDILHGLLEGEDEVRIGPIPRGTPVNLLANLDLEFKFGEVGKHKKLLELLIHTKKALRRIKDQNLNAAESREVLRSLVPDLMDVSKCPDWIVDRGHTFGSELSDEEKRALIEFLKTI